MAGQTRDGVIIDQAFMNHKNDNALDNHPPGWTNAFHHQSHQQHNKKWGLTNANCHWFYNLPVGEDDWWDQFIIVNLLDGLSEQGATRRGMVRHTDKHGAGGASS